MFKHISDRKSSKSPRYVKYPFISKPIIPVYLDDIMLARTESVKRPRKPRDKTRKKGTGPDEMSICPYCGKLLLTRSLNSHIIMHTGKITYYYI